MSKQEENILRPFFIESIEGVSVVNISKTMCDKNVAALKLGVQRVSSIQPVKIVFKFGDVESIEEDTFSKITEIYSNILDLKGSCIMVSSNQNFVSNISSKNDSLTIKLYSDKLNLSELDI